MSTSAGAPAVGRPSLASLAVLLRWRVPEPLVIAAAGVLGLWLGHGR